MTTQFHKPDNYSLNFNPVKTSNLPFVISIIYVFSEPSSVDLHLGLVELSLSAFPYRLIFISDSPVTSQINMAAIMNDTLFRHVVVVQSGKNFLKIQIMFL